MKATPLVLASLTGVALAGPLSERQNNPTKEQLCVNYGGDEAACQRDARECMSQSLAVKKSVDWDLVTECMNKLRPAAPKPQAEQRPAPTKEQLCVGFNGDDEACQREAKVCISESLANKQPVDWDFVIKCVSERRPGGPKQPEQPEVAKQPGATDEASFKADIRADTNRDGVVDVDASTDVEGKNTWSETSGAIFLANIGDTGGRCAKMGPSKDPRTPIETLAQCHDASDDTQRSAQYMAPIRTVPIAGLSGSATATILISDPVTRRLVRVFRPKGDGWEIVNNDTIFSADEIAKGLTLGIDAREPRRAGGWDGRASVEFIVKDGTSSSTDTVMLRVAPVMIHHHRQAIQKVYSSGFPGFPAKVKQSIDDLMSGIEKSMQNAGVPGPLNRLPTADPWAQDYFEPGYTSMPGPNGPVSLRIMIEGRRNSRDSVRLIYTQLRGDGVGGLEAVPSTKRGQDDTFQAGGNIEAIPPYELNGKKYPAGRVIMGGDQVNFPRAKEFFRAQEVQDPLILDSTWLFVKHIDEMIQFVPAKTPRGWSIVAVDPQLGVTLLKEAQNRGFGNESVISAEKTTPSLLRPSIDEFLATESNIQAAEISAKRMQANIDMMKRETGITDAEIFRMPALIGEADLVHDHLRPKTKKRRDLQRRNEAEEEALDSAFFELVDFHGPGGDSDGNGTALESRQSVSDGKPVTLESYLPSLVNGLPLSDSHYLAPKPWGPLINGRDMFEIVAKNVYNKAGFTTVDFLDEWRFHASSGDLHCMTNTFRDASAAWW